MQDPTIRLSKSFRISDDVTVYYMSAWDLNKLDAPIDSPIQVDLTDAVYAILLEHGYVEPSMHPGSLLAGVISILGRRLEEERRRERRSKQLSDGARWRVFAHWFGFSNTKDDHSQAKRDEVKGLVDQLKALLDEERELQFEDERAWAEFRLKCRNLVHKTMNATQRISWGGTDLRETNRAYWTAGGIMRGSTHGVLVEADEFIARFETPHVDSNQVDKTTLSEQDQGCLLPNRQGYQFTYRGHEGRELLDLLHETYGNQENDDIDTTTATARTADTAQEEEDEQNHPVRAYQTPVWWRRNRSIFALVRMANDPFWSLFGLGVAAGIMAPLWLHYKAPMVDFLVGHAHFMSYAGTLFVFAGLLVGSLLIGRGLTKTLMGAKAAYDRRKLKLSTPPSRQAQDKPAVEEPAQQTGPIAIQPSTVTHFDQDNPFRRTPISRLWMYIKGFFYVFDTVGYHSPVTMTVYGVTYGLVMVDLLRARPIFGPQLHSITHAMSTGLVNPADGKLLAALSTSFLAGKAVLVTGNTVVERGQGWIAQAVKEIGGRPFDALTVAGGMGVLVAVEDGWKLLSQHTGRWTVFDCFTASWKPVLLIADTISNPKESLIGSAVMTGLNVIKMLKSPKAFLQGLRNIERAGISALFALIRLPFRAFAYPFLRTVIHATIAIVTHVVRCLMYLTPGLKGKCRRAWVNKACDLSQWVLKLPGVALRLDGRMKQLAKHLRIWHLALLACAIFGAFKVGLIFLGAASTLPITMGLLFIVVQFALFAMAPPKQPKQEQPGQPRQRGHGVGFKLIAPAAALVMGIKFLPALPLGMLSSFFVLTSAMIVWSALCHMIWKHPEVLAVEPEMARGSPVHGLLASGPTAVSSHGPGQPLPASNRTGASPALV